MIRLFKILFTSVAGLLLFGGPVFSEDFSLTQFLNIQYARHADFRSDGYELAYVTNISGEPQVWRILATGGYQTQVTFDTNGVDRAWWSPTDPNWVVVSAAAVGNERSQLYLLSPWGSKWYRVTPDDKAIYAFGSWAQDGSRFSYSTNSRNQKDFDVYEYHAEAKETFLLYQGEGSNTPAEFSPDNRYLLIVREASSFNTDLLLYDRQTGSTRVLTPHEGNVQYRSPIWTPDGKGFYLLTDLGREFLGLAYWPLDSTTFNWIETPDWDIEEFDLSHDGKMLAWTVNEQGYSRFNFRNLERKTTITPARVPAGVIEGLTFSRDGGRLAFSLGGGDKPYDVWVYETVADRLHQITHSAIGGIPPTLLRAPELVEYETFDGRKIPVFWYTPSPSKGKLPVIVAIHGGPESQARPDISGLFQYFLSRGFAVLEPNIRGSSGYGKTYMAMDDVQKRADAVQDVEYAARWLKARSNVDSNKLVIYGGSYGGFMVLASLTTYPDTWAAGIDVVGIANFVSFLENTSPYRRALREAEYGSLAADSAFLTQISPLTHVDKIKAPLFIIQGANDPRVPQTEADQIAAALRACNGIVEYMLFTDEGHGLRKTSNRIKGYSAAVNFLEKHVLTK
jgi:dipeptidyl aminopeptidase/acylaminoacyl peptidase